MNNTHLENLTMEAVGGLIAFHTTLMSDPQAADEMGAILEVAFPAEVLVKAQTTIIANLVSILTVHDDGTTDPHNFAMVTAAFMSIVHASDRRRAENGDLRTQGEVAQDAFDRVRMAVEGLGFDPDPSDFDF